MSLLSLSVLAACFVCYKLGVFNERNPGRGWELVRDSCAWLWRSLNK